VIALAHGSSGLAHFPEARPFVLARDDDFLHGLIGRGRRTRLGSLRHDILLQYCGIRAGQSQAGGGQPCHRECRPSAHSFDGLEFGATASVASYTRVRLTFDNSNGPMWVFTMRCLPSGDSAYSSMITGPSCGLM